MSSVTFLVARPCEEGFCPASFGRCDCLDPRVEALADELSRDELLHYAASGTEEQRAEVAPYLEDYGLPIDGTQRPGLARASTHGDACRCARCDPDDALERRRELA